MTKKSTPVGACWPLSHLRKIPASITHGRAGIQDIAIKLEEQGDGSRHQAQGAELDRIQIYARHDRSCKIGSAAVDNDILRQKLEILAKQAELREQQFAAEFKAKSLEVQLYESNEAELQQQTELATAFGAKLEQAAEREIDGPSAGEPVTPPGRSSRPPWRRPRRHTARCYGGRSKGGIYGTLTYPHLILPYLAYYGHLASHYGGPWCPLYPGDAIERF